MLQDQLIEKLQKIVKELTTEDVKIEINRSKDSSHGDYSSNIALVLGKILKKNPMEVAEEIVRDLGSTIQDIGIDRVEAIKPGFINFYKSSESLISQAEKLSHNEFSFPNIGEGRAAVVEYSSPNIAKPFTIGHLRSTIIGDAIANLVEAVGYKVYRDNHLGDWGSQFGKQIYAIKNIPLRSLSSGGQVPPGDNVEEDNEKILDSSSNPIKDLVNLYVKFHELAEAKPELDDEGRKWFKKLEDGDSEARRLWQKCIDWSFKEFDRIYGELGVPSQAGTAFENNGRGYGEAYFEDKMGPIIEELKEKDLLKESKGAQMVFFPEDALPPIMILKNDGATLYSTRDLATDKFRLSQYPGIDLIVNEVGAEQSLYWKQIFMLEEMLGWYKKGERVHVGHGFFRFKEGKMSTRKGNVIWLQDVLNEAVQRAKKLGSVDEVTAKEVGIGALKWNDLKRSAHLDIAFDWDEVLNMQGNSGPYIQYSYVRTQSLLQKAAKQKHELQIMNYKLNGEELEILRQLDQFSEVVGQAAVTYSPHVVALYLFDLAQMFNNFYQKHRIVNPSSEEEKQFRLALTEAVGNVLKKGLNLLGIAAPEKM